MLVKLTYFKRSGKYYACGEYESDELHLFQIWNEVKKMKEHPGLVCKWVDGPISVDVPDHPFNHPHLVMPLPIRTNK